MQHLVYKIVLVWNAHDQEYRKVYVHCELCPACARGEPV